MADVLSEIRKLLVAKKLVIGTKQVVAGLRASSVARVFVASNCEKKTRATLDYYGKLEGIDVVVLDVPSDELGVVCKKQFAISVLGVSK